MELWEFNLYFKGYKEVYFNEQMNIMKLAYYTGNFAQPSKKKPKPLEKYLNDIDKRFHKTKVDTPVDRKKSMEIYNTIQKLKEMKQCAK